MALNSNILIADEFDTPYKAHRNYTALKYNSNSSAPTFPELIKGVIVRRIKDLLSKILPPVILGLIGLQVVVTISCIIYCAYKKRKKKRKNINDSDTSEGAKRSSRYEII